MTGNLSGIGMLVVLLTLLAGCSGSNQTGAPGTAEPGGSATVTVAGLKIEAFPTGVDGGSVSAVSEDNGVHQVTISEVRIVVKSRDDGSLGVTIDGKDYGTAKAGDELRIDRSRNVFLNDRPVRPAPDDSTGNTDQSE